MTVRPFVIATSGLVPRLNLSAVAEADRFDPTRVESAAILDSVERLDRRSYGQLSMPRWAQYDCVELPGMMFGLGDGEPLEPTAIVLAVPTLAPRHWAVHSVAGDDAAEALAGAIAALRLERVTGITQWSSPTLAVHAKWAPLMLRSAWTPAHSEPRTCVFDYDVLRNEPPAPSRFLDAADDDALRAIQAEIEAGTRFVVTGPEDGGRVPIAEVTP